MLSILTWWEWHRQPHDGGAIPLPHTLEQELGNDMTRVAVPAEMVNDVVQFIRCHSSVAENSAS